MSKRIIALLGGAFVVLALLVIFPLLNDPKTVSNQNVSASSVQLDGKWHQVKSGMPNALMSATISGGKITIDVKMGDVEGVYWVGSFIRSCNPHLSTTIVSVADKSAMTGMYASEDDKKTFTYQDGMLSYPFSILGLNTTVYLSQGA